jgi:NTP pyrophosphatase (non-canonical NTP hydrolase)
MKNNVDGFKIGTAAASLEASYEFYFGKGKRMLTRDAFDAISNELQQAREKFPDQDAETTILALVEEVGEIAKAFLQYRHEIKKGRTVQDIQAEAIQVAAMAIRVCCDCDL